VATWDPLLRQRFGLAIQNARRAKGLSKEELADRSNLQVSFVSRLERGMHAPSLEAIAAVAAALETMPHLLVKAAEDPSESTGKGAL